MTNIDKLIDGNEVCVMVWTYYGLDLNYLLLRGLFPGNY